MEQIPSKENDAYYEYPEGNDTAATGGSIVSPVAYEQIEALSSPIDAEVPHPSAQSLSPNNEHDDNTSWIVPLEPIEWVELLRLVKHNDFASAITQLRAIHLSPVFDRKTKSIKLHGHCSLNDMVKGKGLLADLIREVQHKYPHKDDTEMPGGYRADTSSRPMRLGTDRPELCAIDLVEDKEAIRAWMVYIEPNLPNLIAGLPIGDSYAATLVRRKTGEGMFRPVILFQSSAVETSVIREKIRHGIRQICLVNDLALIAVRFSQGKLTRLAGEGSSELIIDEELFPHHRRYFMNPGLGASIGMGVCSHNSATLGGYILINGMPHMLTAGHLVSEAFQCPECELRGEYGTLNSPSPFDVHNMRTKLDHTLKKRYLAPASIPEEVPLEKVADFFSDPMIDLLEQYDRFLEELNKPPAHFELGKLVQWSASDALMAPTISRRVGQTVELHRMDWAIFRIGEQRRGWNRHRQPLGHATGLEELQFEIVSPAGSGPFCEGARDFHAGEAVYYVGNSSGFRRGVINAAPVTVAEDNRVSQEWAILSPDSDSAPYGDSGAWVFGEDNMVVGMIWGFQTSLLLFTPILEIFTDISLTMHNAEVVLLLNDGRLVDGAPVLFSDRKESTAVSLKHNVDPANLMRFRRSPSPPKEASDRSKIWMNAGNGFDYGMIGTLLENIFAADDDVSFDSIFWEWDLPAVIEYKSRTGGTSGGSQLPGVRDNVILVRNESSNQNEEDTKRTQAMTCAQYLTKRWENKWSSFVLELLDLMNMAELNSAHFGFSMCAMQTPFISVTCFHDTISINFGNKDDLMSVLDLIEALDWLCKAMRMPLGDDRLALSSANYRLQRLSLTGIAEGSSSSNDPSQMQVLRPSISLKTCPLPDSEPSCWQPLFDSCIIADSPLLPYDGFGTGLETSFDLMISLAAAEFFINVGDGIVFIGYQTLLYPTAIQGECAQFHLLISRDGPINPYTMELPGRELIRDPSQLRKMRCFIGWCETAYIKLGTEQLDPTVNYSRGREKEKSLSHDGYSVLGQIGASAPIAAVFGLQTNFKYVSHRLHFTPLASYCQLLQHAAQEVALVYDDAKGRSWLVPKLSLLLHMSRVYASSCVGVPNVQVPSVKVHADAVEVVQELESLGDMCIHGVHNDAFLLRTLMLGLNTNLLNTMVSIKKSNGGALYGFEFRDVIKAPGRGPCMKMLKITSSGRCWLDIVNAVDVVVVCSDLGEAISPAGSGRKSTECDVLPQNSDYLAATLPCLTRLVERQGGKFDLSGGCIRFRISNSIWELSGDPFEACMHDCNSSESCWERVDLFQQLVHEHVFRWPISIAAPKPSSVKLLPLHGAVVFGKV